MHSTEPDRLHPTPTPPRPAEQIDRLILDLRCALERKRIGGASGCGHGSDQVLLQLYRALRAETLWQQEQSRNRRLCETLQEIVALCGQDAIPPSGLSTIERLARAALAQSRNLAL